MKEPTAESLAAELAAMEARVAFLLAAIASGEATCTDETRLGLLAVQREIKAVQASRTGY